MFIQVGCFTTINFSQLIERRIQPYEFDWLKPLMILVQNSPKLKVLLIDVVRSPLLLKINSCSFGLIKN